MKSRVVTIKYESASCDLIPQLNGSVFLLNVMSIERGQGHATKLMEQVCEYADAHEIVLELTVQRFGSPQGGLNNVQLEEFYTKFGFVAQEKTSGKWQPTEMKRMNQ